MKRNTENRLHLLWTFSVLNGISFFLLGFDFNIISLTLFSLISIILTPGFDISQNVFSLKYMSDNKKDDDHFLPKMMFREVILIIGRTSFYVVFGYLFYLGFHQEIILKGAVYYMGFVFLLTALFAQLEENRRNVGV